MVFPPPPISPLFPYTTLFRSHSSIHLDCFWTELMIVLYSKLMLFFPCSLAKRKRIIYQTLLVPFQLDRKSTRLNSSHVAISYAVFCLKQKKVKNKEE